MTLVSCYEYHVDFVVLLLEKMDSGKHIWTNFNFLAFQEQQHRHELPIQ